MTKLARYESIKAVTLRPDHEKNVESFVSDNPAAWEIIGVTVHGEGASQSDQSGRGMWLPVVVIGKLRDKPS
jgi:hypothetical protein